MKDNIRESIEQGMILERLNNLIDTNKREHAAILEQTTKTNGNVSDLQGWRKLVTGGLIVSNIIIVPILLWLITKNLN